MISIWVERVWDSKVEILGFRVWGSGCGVRASGCGFRGSRFWVWGSGLGVHGLRVEGNLEEHIRPFAFPVFRVDDLDGKLSLGVWL